MTTASLPQPTNVADGLVLDHVRLGLDPADLDFIVEDEQVILAGGDGPLLTLHGWDRTDADAMRAMANSLCTACDGHGLVGDDRDCKACSGTGTIS